MKSRKFYFLLFFITSISVGERIFPCPNNNRPKLNNLGKPIQCLPGQDNEVVCGRGYVCFFSGFNYQCCPQKESIEDLESQDIECPDEELTVLDSSGAPLLCNGDQSCPQDNMHCSKIGQKNICCESLTPKSFQIKKGEDKFAQHGLKLHQAKENSGSKNARALDISEFECPAPILLTVLTDDGQPVPCFGSQDCPQDNMECYKIGANGICCENLATARNPKNPLKYRPNVKSKTEVATESDLATDESQISAAEKIRIPTEKFGDNQQNNDYDYGENTTSQKSTIVDEVPDPQHITARQPKKPKNRSRNLALAAQLAQPNTRTNKNTILEYKPHASGGYEVQKLKNSRKRPPEARLLAQQYLLEQIKNGWPYDEKFYRTPNDTR